jgi:hypothetical protein
VLADAEYGFETGHGCKGPLLNALAQMLHATLLQLEEKLVAFAQPQPWSLYGGERDLRSYDGIHIPEKKWEAEDPRIEFP